MGRVPAKFDRNSIFLLKNEELTNFASSKALHLKKLIHFQTSI